MRIVAFAILVLIGTSQAATYMLSGTMDPLQAGTNGSFGTGTGSGSGSISGDYDDVSNTLNYTLTWQDLGAAITNMHFHNAPAGTSGGVDLGIPGPWSSPQVATGILLDAGQETNLLAGDWYVNIHTADFGGGEIRGQVSPTLIPEASTGLLGLLGLAGLCLRRRR